MVALDFKGSAVIISIPFNHYEKFYQSNACGPGGYRPVALLRAAA
jgi:hypothetical protein